MSSGSATFLLVISCCLPGTTASAAAAGGEAAGNDRQTSDKWETDVRASIFVGAWGYRPSKVVSSTSAYTVHGEQLDGTQGRFLISGSVHGRYLHWDFQPYTDVPPSTGHGYHVNTVGLETGLYVPLGETWRLGVYHHSVHNVADGTYGFGVDLNALVADALVISGRVDPSLPGWQHGLRLQAHWYLIDRGSPWFLTRETRLESGQMGYVRARAGFSYAIGDEGRRASCGGYGTMSSGARLAGVSLDCAATWRVTNAFLGTFGRHLLAGPYVSYARNLTRLRAFGAQNLSGGLRLDVLIDENVSQGTLYW